MFEPRPYQKEAIDQIREHYIKGRKKVLLHLATGGGKTFCFCRVLKGAYEKGKYAIMVVRGRKLVDQASQRLDREGVEHGVLMAGHKKYSPLHKIQVCSIDTLRSRKLRPKADIIVIDEAHLATSPSYKEFLEDYPDAFYLPVTATPYTDKSLRHMADHVVKPVTVQELIDDGYLVPPVYYAPSLPNLTGVKTQKTANGNDYKTSDLEEIMEEGALMGDIAEHWIRLAKGRPTLAFCVSVNHSKKLAIHLNNNGIKAVHLDANSTDQERQYEIDRLANKEIDVICNVGILCVGVDIPSVSCIIMARPTKSLNLYIQQAGRGTRPDAGKKDFIILDHAGNVLRLGFITEEREANLDEDKSRKIDRHKSPKQCEVCFAVFEGSTCPQCGNANESMQKEWAVVDGNLKKLSPEELDPVLKFINDLKKICKEKGYKRGWVYFQLKDKFGETIANKYMPRREVPHWVLTGT